MLSSPISISTVSASDSVAGKTDASIAENMQPANSNVPASASVQSAQAKGEVVVEQLSADQVFADQLDDVQLDCEVHIADSVVDTVNDETEQNSKRDQKPSEPNAEAWLMAMLDQQQVQLHARDNSGSAQPLSSVTVLPTDANRVVDSATLQTSAQVISGVTQIAQPVADATEHPARMAQSQPDQTRVVTAPQDTSGSLTNPEFNHQVAVASGAQVLVAAVNKTSQAPMEQAPLAEKPALVGTTSTSVRATTQSNSETLPATRETAATSSGLQNIAGSEGQTYRADKARASTVFAAAAQSASDQSATVRLPADALSKALTDREPHSGAVKGASALAAANPAWAAPSSSATVNSMLSAIPEVALDSGSNMSATAQLASAPVSAVTAGETLARVAAHQSTPEAKWGEQILHALRENVQVQIQKNIQNATIRLDPPELGSLEIFLSHEAGRLNVHINASQADVARMIQNTSERLRQELAGAQFTQVNVQTSADGQSGQQQSRARQQLLVDEMILANEQSPRTTSSASKRGSDLLVTV